MTLPAHDPLPRSCGRVRLRRLTRADLPAFQAYRGDPEVGLYQGWSPLSPAEAEAFLAAMNAIALFRPGTWTQLGLADAATDELLGDIGVRIADQATEAEIGFTLGRGRQGQGLATEAVRGALRLVFEQTRVTRIIGVTDARNLASIRLLLRVGMRHVSTTDTVFRGEPCVEQTYALPRGEEG